MKVEVITKEKQFEPIELKLTIESKRELQLLTSIFNNIDIVSIANNLRKDCTEWFNYYEGKDWLAIVINLMNVKIDLAVICIID